MVESRRRGFAFALAVAVLVGGGLAAGTAAAQASATSTAPCAGVINIVSLAFDPPVVAPGQPARASLVVQNCTDQSQSTRVSWLGRLTGVTPGIPPGCPVLDPLSLPTTLDPGAEISTGLTYTLPASCTASGLTVTVTITASTGEVLATQSAELTYASSPAPVCLVAYRTNSEWRGGFVASVTITNTGTAALNRWSLQFVFPGDQKVTRAWNVALRQSGASVTATNAAHNGVVAPGGSASFGFIGRWQRSDEAPSQFTMNGAPCTSA